MNDDQRQVSYEIMPPTLIFIVKKAADEFKDKTTAPSQPWQTDFTYLMVIGWGWFYLPTVLDDLSRSIVARIPCTTMAASDVTATLDLALQAANLDQVDRTRRLRLLSDSGPSYVANDLSDWLRAQGIRHTRGKPYHPMTQGKIERWHLSLRNRILLENYNLPGDFKRAVAEPVEHCNHRRYHESLDNLTPADVDFSPGAGILKWRKEIKRRTENGDDGQGARPVKPIPEPTVAPHRMLVDRPFEK